MIKWLVVIGVVGFVYFYFIKKTPQKVQTSKPKKEAATAEVNEMIECSICKTYCEVDDMILSGSKYYCSKECLEKA